jgi:hypothetical protein
MRSGILTCYINSEDVRKTLAHGTTLHRTRVWDLPCQERAIEASSNTDACRGRATKDSDFVEKLVRQLLHSLLTQQLGGTYSTLSVQVKPVLEEVDHIALGIYLQTRVHKSTYFVGK